VDLEFLMRKVLYPDSIDFFHRCRLQYVSCSPYRVPIARLSAAQAAIRNDNMRKIKQTTNEVYDTVYSTVESTLKSLSSELEKLLKK